MTYTKIIFYIILILKKFPWMNNKKFTKMGPKGSRPAPISLQSEYRSSNLFHSNTQVTPGNFLI